MFAMKLRIGTKLALSAGAGILLISGMIVADRLMTSQANWLDTQAQIATDVQKDVMNTELQLRRLIIVEREIRLASEPKALDYALGRIANYMAEAIKSLDAAAARTSDAENRERMAQGKTLLSRYAEVLRESGAVQRSILDLRFAQSDRASEWGKRYAELLAAPQLAAAGDREALSSRLERANSAFKDIRAWFWGSMVRSSGREPGFIAAASKTIREQLDEAGNLARDPWIKSEIDYFRASHDRFHQGVDQMYGHRERSLAFLKDTLDPIRLQMDELMGKVKTSAQATADTLRSAMEAEESRADLIKISGGGAIVCCSSGRRSSPCSTSRGRSAKSVAYC
jgi:methyl-accepting chemotaxis protein